MRDVASRRSSWAWIALALGVLACDSSPTASTGPPEIYLDFEGSSLGAVAPVVGDTISFQLRNDTNANTSFWFSFRVRNARGRRLTLRLERALEAANPLVWAIKRPVASADDGVSWSRITDTEVQDSTWVFRHTPASDDEWIALALPYNFSRWTELTEGIRGSEWVQSVEVVGTSIGGNPLHLIRITDATVPAAQKSGVWVVGRQHPGEPEGSYMLEGFLEWVLGTDAQARDLRKRAEINVIGFLNPDGVLAGNQRVNLAGLDLNRVWSDPDPSTAPTITATQQQILDYVSAGGTVRILIDFHAAPASRSNFFFYNEAGTSSEDHHAEIVALMQAATRLNPDFVPLQGSTARPVPTGERARNWAFHRLQTHGLTVEASSNDVTYGQFDGRYLTEVRLLGLGRALGRAAAEVLYGVTES
jgi:predicted deacylase